MSVEIKEDTVTSPKEWKLPTARYITWIKHLFGWHHSSCRHAGKWSMQPHKKIKGPFCSVTNLPLLLPKNRDR